MKTKVTKQTKRMTVLSMLLLLLSILVSCGSDSWQVLDNELEGDDHREEKNPTDATNDYEIYSIGKFNNGLAKISTNKGEGYIDTKGHIVVDPTYNEVPDVFDTIILVSEDNNVKYVNAKGETVYVGNGNEVGFGSYSNGFFRVETMEQTISGNVHTMTYYDKNGTVKFAIENATDATVTTPNHNLNAWVKVTTSLSSFNKWGYTVVNINGKNKFVDSHGDIVVFEGLNSDYHIQRVQENFAIIDCYAMYIDYENRSVRQINDDYQYGVYELNYKYMGNNFGAGYYRNIYYKEYFGIYQNDKIIIAFNDIATLGGASVKDVSLVTDMERTYFLLYLESKDGVFFSTMIDMDGNIIFEPTSNIQVGYCSYYVKDGAYAYTDYSCYKYSAGACVAKDTKTGLFGYIDLQGNWLIEPKYSNVTDFYGEGDNAVAVVENKTIINLKGEVIFTAGD